MVLPRPSRRHARPVFRLGNGGMVQRCLLQLQPAGEAAVRRQLLQAGRPGADVQRQPVPTGRGAAHPSAQARRCGPRQQRDVTVPAVAEAAGAEAGRLITGDGECRAVERAFGHAATAAAGVARAAGYRPSTGNCHFLCSFVFTNIYYTMCAKSNVTLRRKVLKESCRQSLKHYT